MAVFLNWKDYYARTKERITANLFSYLSPRWYPTNIIGSNLYDIFEMYADQLSSASLESEQIFNDLAIETTRNGAQTGRTTSKLYDNFGATLLASKLFGQGEDAYSTGSVLSPYRQELRFLSQAYLIGTTVDALQKAGQGFNGIAPLILEPVKDRVGWQLTSFSASVVGAGRDVMLLDTEYTGIGSIIYTDDIDSPLGKVIYYSNSRLGYNTRLLSQSHFYSGLKVFVYGSSSLSTSFKNSIENISAKLVRADIKPQFLYSDRYVYDRYFYGDSINGDSQFVSKIGDYVTNGQRILSTGSILRSRVTELPSDYLDYEWFYDWATLLKNDAYFTPRVRSYAGLTIPESVYFKDVKFTDKKSVMLQRGTGSGAHYVFHDTESAHDVATGNNSLTLQAPYVGNISHLRPRQGLKLGVYGNGGPFRYYAPTGTELNLYNTQFAIEMWVYGIDSAAVGTFTNFVLKREVLNSSSELLSSAGWRIIIDGTDSQLKLTINDGATEYELGGSIASLFSEEPYRPHYFAVSYNSGKCFIFLDGVEIASGECSLTPPNVSSGYTYLNCEGINIGVDEILIRKEGMLPEESLIRFTDSKPYQLGCQVDSLDKERYHQLEMQVFASGSLEFEYHQFSIRGIERSYLGYPSIATTGGLSYELEFTAKPSLEVLPGITSELIGFTAKPSLEKPGEITLPDSFYSAVSIALTTGLNPALSGFTSKPSLLIPGEITLPESFYATVDITTAGANIVTEGGDDLTTESGTVLER